MITGGEIGAAAGGIVTFGMLFLFLNNKVDKKQDKTLCNEISKNFSEGIHKQEENQKEIMKTLSKITVSNAEIKQELKHMNGKT